MQASFYIIVHNGFSMNFSIRGSNAWWPRARMVHMTALDIQVSLHNPMAVLEDSMTSVNTLYTVEFCYNKDLWTMKLTLLYLGVVVCWSISLDSHAESPGSNLTIAMHFCPSARNFIHIAALHPGV